MAIAAGRKMFNKLVQSKADKRKANENARADVATNQRQVRELKGQDKVILSEIDAGSVLAKLQKAVKPRAPRKGTTYNEKLAAKAARTGESLSEAMHEDDPTPIVAESFGPVVNPNGTPSDFTRAMFGASVVTVEAPAPAASAPTAECPDHGTPMFEEAGVLHCLQCRSETRAKEQAEAGKPRPNRDALLERVRSQIQVFVLKNPSFDDLLGVLRDTETFLSVTKTSSSTGTATKGRNKSGEYQTGTLGAFLVERIRNGETADGILKAAAAAFPDKNVKARYHKVKYELAHPAGA